LSTTHVPHLAKKKNWENIEPNGFALLLPIREENLMGGLKTNWKKNQPTEKKNITRSFWASLVFQ